MSLGTTPCALAKTTSIPLHPCPFLLHRGFRVVGWEKPQRNIFSFSQTIGEGQSLGLTTRPRQGGIAVRTPPPAPCTAARDERSLQRDLFRRNSLSYRPTTLSPGLLAPAFRVLSQAPPLTCERRRPSKAAGTRSPPRRRISGKLPSLRADGLRRPLPCASTPGRRHLRPSARAASLQSHDPLKRGLVAQATRALAAAPFCDRAH